MRDDLISRQAVIDDLDEWIDIYGENKCVDAQDILKQAKRSIKKLPSAQPEQSSEIQDILDYLDTVLHPIVSPEHWNVYSELHDMISTLPSAQPEPSDSVYRLYKRAYEAGQRNAQPELHFDEWCTDCKEYDQERHRCPRWNRVIRETLKDAQPKIIHCRDCKYGEQDEIGRWYCRGLGRQIGDDDGSGFCADAERRTDE